MAGGALAVESNGHPCGHFAVRPRPSGRVLPGFDAWPSGTICRRGQCHTRHSFSVPSPLPMISEIGSPDRQKHPTSSGCARFSGTFHARGCGTERSSWEFVRASAANVSVSWPTGRTAPSGSGATSWPADRCCIPTWRPFSVCCVCARPGKAVSRGWRARSPSATRSRPPSRIAGTAPCGFSHRLGRGTAMAANRWLYRVRCPGSSLERGPSIRLLPSTPGRTRPAALRQSHD